MSREPSGSVMQVPGSGDQGGEPLLAAVLCAALLEYRRQEGVCGQPAGPGRTGQTWHTLRRWEQLRG